MDPRISRILKSIPPVHALLETDGAQELAAQFSRTRVRDVVRTHLEQARQTIAASTEDTAAASFDADAFWNGVRQCLAADDLKRLRRAINATGIVIHTNMGRAPLAEAAIHAVREVAQNYSNLEMDLASGRRGGRGGQASELLCRLTGAEAALVVNNNAAAMLLALGTLAPGGDVVISRGELVEIGGGFRIPDVITQSGARLVEVGTTNKTRLADYARAVTPETRLLLKVHASNYRMVGFTSTVGMSELARLAREQNILAMEDLGSGALIDLARYGLPSERTAGAAVREGADVAAFSGDKLLGGPQCGILVGREDVIHKMAAHPLFRALRADKMTLAALEATLRLYEDESTLTQIPVLRMLMQSPEDLLRRARRLRRGLSGIAGMEAVVQKGVGYSGGGTLPEEKLPTWQVAVRPTGITVDCLTEALRRGEPPIVGMAANGQFVMDARTIQDSEVREIIVAFGKIADDARE